MRTNTLTNLNDGVGKKIVEALKKQTESGNKPEEPNELVQEDNLGVNIDALDEITNNGLLSNDFDTDNSQNEILNDNMFLDGFGSDNELEVDTSFEDYSKKEEKVHETADIPANIVILKKLISQLPSGVTRHTGAQIIRQTIEALGISMKSVLTEAQEVQNNLKESSKECQITIQEYKQKIANLEKQTQNYQKQYAALNDLISLFIQTGK